ncbi:hypothetical protein J4E86_000413 [Alternaria arbusti]|uniref:uncharacterized protein n=1 Tax=Alternaria arbusti TaxID=232088 RepID=UPI002220928B|nr:uncharacterized protein J4E86_000413 [Alternaria arbusti]KAI4961385.1 hypothetical protein J4E86_000413 [Alternaria arbusti]
MAPDTEGSDFEDDDDDTKPDLRTLLSENFIKSAFEKTPHKFVPDGIIHELITEESISEALEIHARTRGDAELVEFIRMHAKKVFAIFIYTRPTKLLAALNWWRKKDMNDRDLPITIQPEWKKQAWFAEFCEHQWKFLAPVFSTARYNHNLEEDHILPFVSKESDSGRGSFGVVSQYTLHDKHLDPALLDRSTFAVKEIQSSDDAQEVAEHWEREVKALRTMNELNQEHIVRFITAFRRRRGKDGQDHYLMFEWADGGNLRSMWKRVPSPTLTVALVKDAMFQILGLARALDAAHNLNNTGSSYRHGDIKPENILCFNNGREIGTLKIGDWGEAKEHGQVTEMRPSKTTAKYGTRVYEAPEVETGVRAKYLGQSTKRRSRLYDIWAMGCITLEFTIWLLEGHEGLTKFRPDLGEGSFYEISIQNGKKVAHVHKAAIYWMNKMGEDPRCQAGTTAIGDLLELVRTALLVVKLPRRLGTNISDRSERSRTDSVVSEARFEASAIPASETPFGPGEVPDIPPAVGVPSFSITPADPEPERIPIQPEPEAKGPARCLANEFRSRMEGIIAEDPDGDEGYWLTYWVQPLELRPTSDLVLPPSPTTEVYSGEVFQKPDWEQCQDSIDGLIAPSQRRIDYAHPELDEDDWKYQSGNDVVSDLFAQLKESKLLGPSDIGSSSRLCPNCICLQDEIFVPGFSRSYDTETLRLNAESKFCNLCVLLWQTATRDGCAKSSSIKLDRTGSFLRMRSNGLPVLSIVRHPEELSRAISDAQMGFFQLPEAGSTAHLGVLQHWLNDCDGHHQCSPPKVAANGAKLRLPTRLIDVGTDDDDLVRLWETKPSDGPQGDFMTEAKRMEEVYSGAYCVVAASCATDHYDGFLKPRSRRDCVRLCGQSKGQPPFYLCQNIDNFKDHVLDGELHQRGWVLQEHALARRTLFFTEHQTYFECGNGVRCETSTKLSNPLAAFLGDPDFPNIVRDAPQGEKILRYQELYRKFSRLDLKRRRQGPIMVMDGIYRRDRLSPA